MNTTTLAVLLVADLPDERLSLRRLLTLDAPGAYTVIETDRGDRALATCQVDPPDCVLLADHLPDQDALMVLASLRAGSDVPVVLLTSGDSETLALEALQRGAQDYLVTGALTAARLHATIQHAVTIVRRTRERERALTLLTTMLDALPLGTTILDQTLHVIQANTTVTTLLGRPAAALRGLPLSALWPDLAAALAPDCVQVLASGQPSGPREVVSASPAGVPRVWQATVHPLVLPDTGAPGLGLVLQEVTAQCQTCLALQANEQRRTATQVLHAAISAALSPELTVAATRQALVRLPLPALADYCVLYLREEDGLVRPVAACTGDPAQMLPLEHLPSLVSLVGESDLADAALGSGMPRLLTMVPPEMAPALGPLAPRSALLVPLVTQGHTLGALLLGLTTTERRYDAANIALAEALARRGAEALAQAQLRAEALAAQQAAAEAHARLDAIFTSAPIGIAYLDRALRYQLVNPTLAALNGRTPEDHLGHTLAEVVPGLAPRLEHLARQVLTSGATMHELELRGQPCPRDGIAHDWIIRIYPIADPTGAVTGVGMAVTDITQYKRTAAALRASEARFRQLAEHALDVIYRFRLVPTLTLEYFSPAIEQLTGYPREAFYQDPTLPLQLIHPDDRSIFQTTLTDFIALAQPVILRWQHQDGTSKWAELHSWLVTDDNGQPLVLEGIGRDITGRQQAEAALRENQLNLATLIENTDGSIWSIDDQYRLIVCNTRLQGAVKAVIGRELVPGECLVALPFPQAELDAWRTAYDRALSGESFSIEWTTHATAEPRTKECRLSPIRTAAGVITGVTIFGRDVTAQQRADRALRETERKLGTLFAILPVGIAIFDVAQTLVYVNPALEQILRMDRAGLLRGDHLARAYFRPDGTPRPPEELVRNRMFRERQAVTNQVNGFRTEAGELVWTSVSAVPVDFPDWRVVIVTTDVTARKQTEGALRASEARYRTLFETMAQGVIYFAVNGQIIAANPAAERILGLSQHQLLDRAAQDHRWQAIHADGSSFSEATFPVMVALHSGQEVRNVVMGVYNPIAEAYRWIRIHAVPQVRPGETTPAQVYTLFEDITARKQDEATLAAHAEALSRSNAELTRALRLKDEFLAMMSHELRTPLNVVLGLTDAMHEELYGPLSHRQRQALTQVTQSGRHLLSLLADILDLAHLEAGQASLDVQRIDVDILCRSALQFVQSAAQQKTIRLLRTVADGAEGLCADERRLTQILVNLLDNAVKFTPAGGTVGLEVSADQDQACIQFAVWDTGIGIAEAEYDRLFQPFTQVDGRLSRQYGGIGLGLTLVRRLVDLHGGSISLASTPGQGSRFTVSLPWTSADNVAPLAAPPAAPAAPGWAQPPRVVIADDHEPTLQFYAELLRQLGCTVAVARTGAEALAQVRATRPDVAVLDIQMPELDGLTAIRHLRADPALSSLPIIVLTALAMPGDRERCLEAGANAYLAKPVSLRTLVATITRCVGA